MGYTDNLQGFKDRQHEIATALSKVCEELARVRNQTFKEYSAGHPGLNLCLVVLEQIKELLILQEREYEQLINLCRGFPQEVDRLKAEVQRLGKEIEVLENLYYGKSRLIGSLLGKIKNKLLKWNKRSRPKYPTSKPAV